jgi:3-isopropylmalate/(R)-2-methylmalate dehydratase small subunit
LRQIQGKVWTFGDKIDTDLIMPHAYLMTDNPEEQVEHAFESLYDKFYEKVKPGDIIVAGKNFGAGSSREEAVFVLKEMGISAVLADSIARIFYRNLINLGIIAIQIPGISRKVNLEDILVIELKKGTVTNIRTTEEFAFQPIPDHILKLIDQGGMINYLQTILRKH